MTTIRVIRTALVSITLVIASSISLTAVDVAAGASAAIRPGTPSAVSAVRGNTQATVTWTNGAANGSGITSYKVYVYWGAMLVQTKTDCTGSPCVVSGLVNGWGYTFKVSDMNGLGEGALSASSNVVVPAAVPGAPTSVSATPGNTQATVTWTNGANNGSGIASYKVYAYTGTTLVQTKTNCTGSPCVVTGLANGTAYTFKVSDVNGVGEGALSLASIAVTPATLPGTPRNVLAFGANGAIDITWDNPTANGGSPITRYTATATAGSSHFVCTAVTAGCTITGLVNGTNYSVQVVANNIVGAGQASGLISSKPNRTQNCTKFVPFANLQKCNLQGANLTNTNLTGADLTGANIVDAVLTNANLTSSVLTNVWGQTQDGSPLNLPTGWSFVRVSAGGYLGGYLIGPGADLRGAYLANANLRNTNLTGADLKDAILTGVISGSITGIPNTLPPGWGIVSGYLIGPGADLRGAYLANANLRNTNLTGADLKDAILTGVISGSITGIPNTLPSSWGIVSGYLIGPGANLSDAAIGRVGDFHNISLAGANLTRANLELADLGGVSSGNINGIPSKLPYHFRLWNGYLIGPGAVLTNANLEGFNSADAFELNSVKSGGISGAPASLPTSFKLINGYLVGPSVNLSNANLDGMDLANADLDGVISGGITGTPASLPTNRVLLRGYLIGPYADLRNATLTNANLSGMDLSYSRFDGADLSGANFSTSILLNASFNHTKLINANLKNQTLSGSNWDFQYTDFTRADMRGIHVQSENLMQDDFSYADLTDSVFDGTCYLGPRCSFNGSTMSGTNLTRASFTSGSFTSVSFSWTNLSDTKFIDCSFIGITSGGISGVPYNLPYGWSLSKGILSHS